MKLTMEWMKESYDIDAITSRTKTVSAAIIGMTPTETFADKKVIFY